MSALNAHLGLFFTYFLIKFLQYSNKIIIIKTAILLLLLIIIQLVTAHTVHSQMLEIRTVFTAGLNSTDKAFTTVMLC